MITIPHTNKTGLPIRRVTLFHSGGLGSTLVLYYLMKDIIDRDLDCSINCLTLDTNKRFKEAHFGPSSAKKCQKLTGFDSDRLLIQTLTPELSIDSDAQRILSLKYFKFSKDSDTPQTIGSCQQMHSLTNYIGFNYDSEDYDTFVNYFTSDPKFKWKYNVINRDIAIQMYAADSDGDTALLDSLADSYANTWFKTMCQFVIGNALTDIIYTGDYRNPPEVVQSNFHSGRGVTAWEEYKGYYEDLDSEIVDIDPGGHWHTSDGRIVHWYEKRPLMSKGDSRDLYNMFYSQDSDLEELFWYTRSCHKIYQRSYTADELESDSDLLAQWDSDTFIFDQTNNDFFFRVRGLPLHRFIPHCRKCWKCQNRGYGFEAWLDSEDDQAWLRNENVFNPPQLPSVINDAIVIFDMANGGSFPGPTSTDLKNVGTIDGVASITGTASYYDSDAQSFICNGNNSGIVSQNIRPYMSSAGVMSVSVWLEPKRTTGSVFAETSTLAGTADVCEVLELQDGVIKAGFYDQYGGGVIRNAGTIDSDVLTNIVITFDSDGVFTCYVNGEQTGQLTEMTRTLDASAHTLLVGFNNNNITYSFEPIQVVSGSHNDYSGGLKRFSYFNRALTETEVAGLYQEEEYITSQY